MALLAQMAGFDPNDPLPGLQALPEAQGIYALFGADPAAEPYLSKTVNLRRRLLRFLHRDSAPAAIASRRLQLAHMVRRIEYTVTGSEFESALRLLEAANRAFGGGARRRMRLRPAVFVRMSTENAYPRIYVTTRVTKAAADALFGPFPSRGAAERYAEEVLNLFLLRRCVEELNPDPAFPGCPYSEMKMCLAPCFKGCSDERYREEAKAVFDFLSTRGASMLEKLEAERSQASEALDFERAAAVHQRIAKAAAAAHLAGDAVHPLAKLDGLIVQPASSPSFVALFRLRKGALHGPVLYSTEGMRLANEGSGSTSLFAQPVMMEAAPLDTMRSARSRPARDILNERLDKALEQLREEAPRTVPAQTLAEQLSLFSRWFYQTPATKKGEAVFDAPDGRLAHKAVLRAISRIAAAASP